MVAKKWLNIIVDGSTALRPHWPHIFSNYLENIARCFLSNCHEEEAYLGLVFYKTDIELGYDIRFVEWTKDVKRFLETLSSLPFNENDNNQNAMVEGLAKALMMFPGPYNYKMTTQEYPSAERHCLLVTAGEPIPIRMLVSVPSIREGQVDGQHVKTHMADFLEVAQIFVPLDVSLSVITPNDSPIFRAIFNQGNNISLAENSSMPNHGINQDIVLLSKKFQEAHVALHENITMNLHAERGVESMNIQTGISLPNIITGSFQGPIQQVWHHQPGITTMSNRLGIIDQQDPPQIYDGASFQSLVTTYAVGNSPMEVQPHSTPIIPVLHDATSQYATKPTENFSGQPMEKYYPMTSYRALNSPLMGSNTWVSPVPGMAPTSYPRNLLPPPSLSDLRDYVKTWEGFLAGAIQLNRLSIIKAQAFRKATSPSSLQWSSRLEISLFLPENAVNHTKSISSGPVDYVFFNTLSKSNKLYEHLFKEKMCAKIDFPYQSLILSTTEKEHFFLGLVFPRETIFVEPL